MESGALWTGLDVKSVGGICCALDFVSRSGETGYFCSARADASDSWEFVTIQLWVNTR